MIKQSRLSSFATALVVVAFPLIACDAEEDDLGETSDAGLADTTVDSTTEGEGADVTSDTSRWFSCSASRLDGADGPLRHYNCWASRDDGEDGPFDCECDGTLTGAVDAASCDEALQETCGVAPGDNHCDSSGIGICWTPDGGEDWACRCEGGDADLEPVSGTCWEALFGGCSDGCDVAGEGGCVPNLETGVFDCECEDGRVGTSDDVDCERAVHALCAPACTSDQGVCFVGDDFVSFDCRCTGEADYVNLRYDDLGHDDPCGTLESVCGPPSPADGCESESSDGSARGDCRVSGASYSCNCTTPDSEGSTGGSVDGRSCEEILGGYCPEAFQ